MDAAHPGYPLIWDLLAVQFPALEANHSEVWRAFKNHCGNEEEARKALKFGQAPFLEIMNLWGNAGADQNPTNPLVGHFPGRDTPSRPHRIRLHRALADEFQRSGLPQLRPVVEAALLHETVHYVRYKVGLPEPQYEGFGDKGTAFEVEAYGSHISLDAFRLARFPSRS